MGAINNIQTIPSPKKILQISRNKVITKKTMPYKFFGLVMFFMTNNVIKVGIPTNKIEVCSKLDLINPLKHKLAIAKTTTITYKIFLALFCFLSIIMCSYLVALII